MLSKIAEAVLGSCLGLGMLVALAVCEMILDEIGQRIIRPRPSRILRFRKER